MYWLMQLAANIKISCGCLLPLNLDDMSRNLYILSAALVVFSLVSFGMSWTHASNEPGLPGEAQMWRTMALLLFLLGTVSCLIGTITHMFEQASRRHEERELREGRRPPQ